MPRLLFVLLLCVAGCTVTRKGPIEGFDPLLSPDNSHPPGYVVRCDKDGHEQGKVGKVDVTTEPPAKAVLPNYTYTATAGTWLKILAPGVNANVDDTQTLTIKFIAPDEVTRIAVADIPLQQPLEAFKKSINPWRTDSTYFLIREVYKAKRLTYVITETKFKDASAEASYKQLVGGKAGTGAYENANWVIDREFSEPMIILRKLEAIPPPTK